jgi:basic membrane protein A and related proteins
MTNLTADNPAVARSWPRPTLIFLVSTLLFLLAACGDGQVVSTTGGAESTTAASGEDTVTIALLFSGPANDGGFYQSMADGLAEAAEEDGAVDLTIREKLGEGGDAALENAVREAAASGDFDLIVGHGFDIVPAIGKFAVEFPDQAFVTSLPVEGDPANVSVYLSKFNEIGYAAGFLAAAGTENGKVAFVSGPGLPFEVEGEAGFRQAVEDFAPGSDVSVVYTGDFDDAQLGLEAVRTLVSGGVDSITNWLAAGQSGVYEGCSEDPAVVCFGNSPYSAPLAPEVVHASFLSNYEPLLPLWVDRIRNDNWTNTVDILTLENGGVGVTDATGIPGSRLEGLQTAIDDFRQKVESGEVAVEPAPTS